MGITNNANPTFDIVYKSWHFDAVLKHAISRQRPQRAAFKLRSLMYMAHRSSLYNTKYEFVESISRRFDDMIEAGEAS